MVFSLSLLRVDELLHSVFDDSIKYIHGKDGAIAITATKTLLKPNDLEDNVLQ